MNDVEIAMSELKRFPKKTAAAAKKKYVPPFEMLTVEEVAEILRVSKNTVYRMLDEKRNSFDPTFPQPLQVAGRNTRWRADEITKWLLQLPRGVGEPINTK